MFTKYFFIKLPLITVNNTLASMCSLLYTLRPKTVTNLVFKIRENQKMLLRLQSPLFLCLKVNSNMFTTRFSIRNILPNCNIQVVCSSGENKFISFSFHVFWGIGTDTEYCATARAQLAEDFSQNVEGFVEFTLSKVWKPIS